MKRVQLGVVMSLLCWAILWTTRPALALQAQPAEGAAGGSVVQIGFQGAYHPGSWVPMRVRLNPPGGETGLFLLRVHQRDLDGDNVIFERTLTLTGGIGGQEFWTYFKPEPIDGGFDANDAASLRARLRVVLCDEDGRELAQLAIQNGVRPLYSGGDFLNSVGGPGRRLVLAVADPAGGDLAGYSEFGPTASVGLMENVEAVQTTTRDLPDRPIGLDSVDVIVWQDADPAELREGAGQRLQSLREWVRRGGHLIITARSEWQSLEAFGDLLPVTPSGALDERSLAPLQAMVAESPQSQLAQRQGWTNPAATFRYVTSTPKAETRIITSFDGESEDTFPFLARMPYGFGCVTWVATDLSRRELTGPPNARAEGWVHIWTHILGTGDRPQLFPEDTDKARFATREFVDLGDALLQGVRLSGKSVALVTVAMIFFIAYWLIAGPGLYFYLASKRKAALSWFLFGAAAVAATLVTLGLVRLVLRGPPELKHVSFVRQGRMAPTVVHTEMGLYIPRDGEQRLVVDGGLPDVPPTLTAYNLTPDKHDGGGGRTNPITYTVHLDGPDPSQVPNADGSAALLQIPYRSTLKKLEADWTGPSVAGVTGNPRLITGRGLCTGRLVNNSGLHLKNVYIAFPYPRRSMQREAFVLFLPTWQAGQTLPGVDQLIRGTAGSDPARRVSARPSQTQGPPNARTPVYGELRLEWAPFWYTYYRSSLMTPGAAARDDWSENIRRSPAMLSLFNMLPPMSNEGMSADATQLLRRGARELDITSALIAGQMVIIAEAEEAPLPVPLRVEGEAVAGEGRTIYQFVLPLDTREIDALRDSRDDEAGATAEPTTQQAPDGAN